MPVAKVASAGESAQATGKGSELTQWTMRAGCFFGGWALWYFVFHGQNIWLVLDTALVLRKFVRFASSLVAEADSRSSRSPRSRHSYLQVPRFSSHSIAQGAPLTSQFLRRSCHPQGQIRLIAEDDEVLDEKIMTA